MRTARIVWSLGFAASEVSMDRTSAEDRNGDAARFSSDQCFALVSAPLKAHVAQLDLKLGYSIAGAVADTETAANGAGAPFVADRASKASSADRANQGVEKNRITATEL
jgi:hypothetical protein